MYGLFLYKTTIIPFSMVIEKSFNQYLFLLYRFDTFSICSCITLVFNPILDGIRNR